MVTRSRAVRVTLQTSGMRADGLCGSKAAAAAVAAGSCAFTCGNTSDHRSNNINNSDDYPQNISLRHCDVFTVPSPDQFLVLVILFLLLLRGIK